MVLLDMKTIVNVLIKEKEYRKLPKEIIVTVRDIIDLIEEEGMVAIRRVRGYNDEKLIGKRIGQRSIRLNRSWRLIYEESGNSEIAIIDIVEVTKHHY